MVAKQESAVQRRSEPKSIRLDVATLKEPLVPELAEIDPDFRKYVQISDDFSMIEQFTCPVAGCSWSTDQGPGALRMHMIIAADPRVLGRYCAKHEAFLISNPNEMTIDGIRYLAQFPSNLHLDAVIKNIRE